MTDALLFTPGPLTTSETVKRAMLHDLVPEYQVPDDDTEAPPKAAAGD